MDAALKNLFTKLASFWKGAAKRAKILLVGGLAAALVLAVVLSTVLTGTRYALLYSGLSDSESGQIVTQLKTTGVKYKVQSDGIYVDAAKANETRMQMAESGYPQTTLNYSIYTSGNSWAETDSDKKIKALYQLQNRLQDTIDTIPGIVSSVVTIVENQSDTYVLTTDQVKPSASVKLNLKNGISLSQKQVNGIVQLVSHSVPSLSKDDVTVLDSDGTQLNADSGDASGTTTTQLELKSKVESEIKTKVLSVLNPVFGSGNVQVAAGATLDFSQKTTSTTTYTSPNSSTPGVGVPTSQSTTTTVSGTGDTAGGAVGVNNGQPTYVNGSTATGGTVTQSSAQTSYLYNTVNQQIQDQGGSITGLTIAVLLNNKSESAAGINPNDVRQTVAFAVGLTDTAGISVQLIPFLTKAASSAPAPAAAAQLNLYMVAGSAGVLVLVILLLLLFMILSHRRRRNRAAKAAAELPELLAAAAREAQPGLKLEAGAEDAATKLPLKPVLPAIKSIGEKLQEAADQNVVKNQISDFAKEKPELVAQLLRNWLKD